ncbi:hypothetical protein GEMRC1_011816 [Eukaryota sp. GEM-RC1]
MERSVDVDSLPQRSLRVFDINNIFRRFCLTLVFNSWFDWVILAVILMSLAPLMFLSHSQSSELESTLFWFDFTFTAIFTIELFLRMVAVGLIASPKSILRDPFGCLDLIIVAASLLAFTPFFQARPTAFRLLRVLRPLRSLSSVPQMRNLVKSLIFIFPAIGPVLLFTMFFVFVGGTFGVHLLRGTLAHRCTPLGFSPEQIMDLDDWDDLYNVCSPVGLGPGCPINHDCLPGYENPEDGWVSFDNIWLAVINLFWGLTLEGWAHVASWCYQSLGVIGFGYMFLVCVTGAFYVLNLFTAVVATKFGEISEKHEYIELDNDLTGEKIVINATEYSKRLYASTVETQTEVIDYTTRGRSYSIQEQSPGKIRKLVSKLVLTVGFEVWSTVFVILNAGVLSVYHYGMSSSLEKKLDIISTVITVLFAIEVLLRVISSGGFKKHFLKSFFDGFDLVIVAFALLEMIALMLKLNVAKYKWLSVLRVLRLARVLRILSLSRSWKSFHRLLLTLAKSLKSMIPFVILIVVFLFIFAAVGVEVFDAEKVKLDYDPDTWYFSTFKYSLINTWLTSTGEDWNDLAADTLSYAKKSLCGWNFLYCHYCCVCISINELTGGAEERRKHVSLMVTEEDLELSDSPKETAIRDNIKPKIPIDPSEVAEVSCFVLRKDHWLRKICMKISYSTVFTVVIYILVFFSCLNLALQQPSVSLDHWSRAHSDIIFNILTVIFLLELLINIIARSAFGVNGMFRSSFVAFDSSIILLSGLEFLVPGSSNLALLRSFRALRPLRLLSLSTSGKMVLKALMNSVPALVNATLLFFIFLLVFGIIGVSMLGHVQESVQEDPGYGYLIGFDNVPRAVYSLFSFTTQEYLPAAFRLYAYDVPTTIYFTTYMVIGFWIITQVFISLLTEEFSDSAGQLRFAIGETDEVRRARMVLSTIKKSVCSPIRPSPNSFVLRRFCFRLSHHPYFDQLITVLIVMNSILLAMYTADMSDSRLVLFRNIGHVFTIIFALEIIIKVTSDKWTFFKDNWNNFDLFVVLGTSSSFFITNDFTVFIILLRLLRVFRIIRLSKRLESVKKIFRTTAIALPALSGIATVSVVIFLFLQYLECSYLVKFLEIKLMTGFMILSSTLNLFFPAIFTLFMSASGEEWQSIMVEASGCPPSNPDCNGTVVATAFFLPLIYICRFVFLNLISAAIVDAFVTASRDFQAVVAPTDVTDFVEAWKKVDPDGVGFTAVSDLDTLFTSLKPPLSPGANAEVVSTVLRTLDVPVYSCNGSGHYVCIYDLLPSVVLRLLGPTILLIPKDVDRTTTYCHWRGSKLARNGKFTKVHLSVRDLYAARFVSRKWKELEQRKITRASEDAVNATEMQFMSELLDV